MKSQTAMLTCALIVTIALLPAWACGDAGDKDTVLSLFNGRDLTGWKFRGDPDKAKAKSKWVVGRCELDPKNPANFNVTDLIGDARPGERLLINAASSVDLVTKQNFKDCIVKVEFMIPKGSNSGIYLMGQFEVQIYDTFGKKDLGPGDMGGIYSTAAPKVNACKKYGEWQTFVIDFQAPRFEGAKKVANAKFVKVVLNDQVIHENVEPKGPTGGELQAGEVAEGPLMIQGDHGPIAIKSIHVTPVVAKR